MISFNADKLHLGAKGKKMHFCFFLEVFRDLLCILLLSLQASGALLEGGSLLSKDISSFDVLMILKHQPRIS